MIRIVKIYKNMQEQDEHESDDEYDIITGKKIEKKIKKQLSVEERKQQR